MQEPGVDAGECRLRQHERPEGDDRRIDEFTEPREQEPEEDDTETPPGEPRLPGTSGFDDRPEESPDRDRSDEPPTPWRIGEYEQQPGQRTENDGSHTGSL